MDQLRYDNAYPEIKGYKVSSEKVRGYLIKAMPESSLEELRLINKTLLSMQSKGTTREVIMNFDDTVYTIFREQEGASVGYNPKYHGRPYFIEKIGIIADTDELVNVIIEEDKHHTNQREHLYPWTEIDKTFSVNEIYAKMPKGNKPHRIVIIRKKLPQPKTGQICTDIDEFKYEYQAIVTNVEYMTPEEIFHEYNQRCDIENKTDELKEGFAFNQNSQRNKFCNKIFLLIKMIIYNLYN